jgi:DNA-binding PadR family transcriptional regulator
MSKRREKRAMYELIVLSLLIRGPLHGYLIAQIANDIIGPWAKISNGTLYPLLTKLEQAELIERASDAQHTEESERSTRTFKLTSAGSRRFYQLMMDTSTNIGDYQRLFHLKVPYLDILQPRERLHLLNHYLSYCQACVLHNTTHAGNLVHELEGSDTANRQFQELALQVMQERAKLWQTEIDWILRLREKLVIPGESPLLHI